MKYVTASFVRHLFYFCMNYLLIINTVIKDVGVGEMRKVNCTHECGQYCDTGHVAIIRGECELSQSLWRLKII